MSRVLESIPKTFERSEPKAKERQSTPNKIVRRLDEKISQNPNKPKTKFRTRFTENLEMVSENSEINSIKSSGPSHHYFKATKSFAAKMRQGNCQSEDENEETKFPLKPKTVKRADSKAKLEWNLSTNINGTMINSQSEQERPTPNTFPKSTLMNRTGRMPAQRKVWKPLLPKKKVTKAKPFNLETTRRAQTTTRDESRSTSNSEFLLKKSTKLPTIPREFRFRTEERSKQRKVD